MVGILKMDSGVPSYGLQFPRGHPGCVEVRDSVLKRLWLWFGVSRVQCLGIAIHSCHVPLVNLWGARQIKERPTVGYTEDQSPSC